jgi:hypothetical protein
MNDNEVYSTETDFAQENMFENVSEVTEVQVETPTLEQVIEPEVLVEPTPVVEAAPVVEPTPVVEDVVAPKKEKEKTSKKSKVEGETVALYSTSNLHQGKAGSLTIGYNIVLKEHADIWLRSKKVRIATPEEVAQYYNK